MLPSRLAEFEITFVQTLKRKFKAIDINDAQRAARIIETINEGLRLHSIIALDPPEKPDGGETK